MRYTDRQIRGAQSKMAGEVFERVIDRSCAVYADMGYAYIIKTPEPMRPIGRAGDGKFIAVYTGTAQPDYKGCLNGGRCVVFEAKHTDSDKIAQSRVTANQTAMLDRYNALGAWCFVLVSFGGIDCFRIPWEVWQGMKERFGRKSMTKEDCEPFRVKANLVKQMVDFLR